MRVLLTIFLTTMLSLTFTGCSDAAGMKRVSSNAERKGAGDGMKTYYIGRFSIDVPKNFKLEVQKHKFRLVEITEDLTTGQNSSQFAEQKWRDRITEIQQLKKHKDVKKIIIDQQKFEKIGEWANGVLYYHDYMTTRRVCWEIWVAIGQQVVCFKLIGRLDAQDKMLEWMTDVIKAYRPSNQKNPSNNTFYTEFGAINLPYKRQESTYARFEGPNGVSLKVEMNEIHKEPEEEGIIDRTVAAMATGFAAGLEIKKIRSRKHTAAELPGEEEILEGDDGRKKNVSFDWEYAGKVDSGEHLMIHISIDTLNDDLEDKIKIWDRILESFRPASKTIERWSDEKNYWYFAYDAPVPWGGIL